jgi:hypothetical protein
MLFGPRLDRPSAIGEEGRPRATSLTISAVIVVGIAVAAGALAGKPLAFTAIAPLVGLMSAGMTLLDRDSLGQKVIGHLCFLPSAVFLFLFVTVVGISSLDSPGTVLVIVGLLTAMFGVTIGWDNVSAAETVGNAVGSSAISYVFWLAGVSLIVLVTIVGWVVFVIIRGVQTPTASLLTLLGLIGLAFVSVYLASGSIPVVQMTPVHRRDTVRLRYDRIRSRLMFGVLGSWGTLVLLIPLVVVPGMEFRSLLTIEPIATLLVELGQFSVVPLLAVSGIGILIPPSLWGLKQVTSGYSDVSMRTVAAFIGAGGYLAMIVVSLPILIIFVGLTFGIGLLIFVVPVVLYILFLLGIAAIESGIVPERAGPSALSAAGLLCAGIGGALSGFPSLFVFGAVAGGLIVWDIGTFGLGVTAELGHLPESRNLELRHAAFSAGIGFVGIAVLSLLDLARRSVASGLGTPAAMGIAVVGVALLLVPLRG